MVQQKTYKGTPGDFKISDPQLFGVQILGVERNGLGHRKVTTAQGNQEFRHIAAKIVFDSNNPFFGTLADDIRESVWVMWQ